MAFALHPLAVQNVPLLRELGQSGAAPTVAEIARRITRDESNVRKSIKALMTAGLAMEPMCLTVEGAAQLAAIDRAAGRVTDDEPGSPAPIAGVLALAHAQILPDPENARRDWDSDEAQDELDALRQDIIQNGLLQNLVVRPAEPLAGGVEIVNGAGEAPNQALALYTLVGGERRWRAIGAAIFDGDWPEDRLIPCRLLETDDLGHRLAALAENLQRRNLNPIEKAKAFEGLADAGLSNKEIADRVSSTPEHVQQHRRFLQLDAADQQRMTLARDDPRHLSVREARQKLATKAATAEAAKPLDLTPMTRLAMAEMVHAVFAAGTHRYASIPVAPDAAETEEAQRLQQIGFIRFEGLSSWGENAGRFTACLGYGQPQLDPPFPNELYASPEARDAALRREQALAIPGGVPADADCIAYATPWIADIGDYTEEGAAIVEERRRTREENEAAEQKREQDRAELLAVHAAAAAKARTFFEEARAVKAIAPSSFVEVADNAEAKLPWRISHDGGVIAADGTAIIGGSKSSNDRGEARMRLLVLAVNAAAGLETPDDQPPPEPEVSNEPDEATFVDQLADAVMALRPEMEGEAIDQLAAQILATFLQENAVEFGDSAWAWDAEGAAQLAEEHLAHDDAGEDAEDEAA